MSCSALEIARSAALLRQEIGFLDVRLKMLGILTGRLGEDARQVQALAGPLIGVIFQHCVPLDENFILLFCYHRIDLNIPNSQITSLGVAFYIRWELTLVFSRDSRDWWSWCNSGSTFGINYPKPKQRPISKGVKFTNPTRPDGAILKGFEFPAASGTTVALVVPSLSGKSFCMTLAQWFYDVDGGQVQLENLDVREWDVKTLREKTSALDSESK
ncbi:hypothetical protein BJ742DRAFT_456859 [Cladochytrium replicatum]|nr:hypothetical protein BJ742DRAFT_456859 [Cladochytrium replicatum]